MVSQLQSSSSPSSKMPFSKMKFLETSSNFDAWKEEVDKVWKMEKGAWKKLSDTQKFAKLEEFKEKLLEVAFTSEEKKFVSQSFTHEEIWPGKFCDPVANCSGG